ncbi:MAG: dTMP kinase [Burkholderiales bacterium]|jgi:dTMP kinase|nr:dTMP kinase [Burkholderiales bacterium]
MSTRARFVTFEGIDGAGKSTQLAHAVRWLRARGIDVVETREPGGTAFGEALRAAMLAPGDALSGLTEVLAMFAARSHHLDTIIRPALAAGRWVVCDRFTDATVAYQHHGRGVPRTAIDQVQALVHPDLEPDRTYVFAVAAEVAQGRRLARGGTPDRFERESDAFHARVAAGYRALADEAPRRIVVVSDHYDKNVISNSLEASLTQLLGGTPSAAW